MTFASVYEILDPLTTVRKQRFWDWFDGNDLRSIWNFTDVVGTGSGAMDDSVGNGYQITTGATDDNESAINFNDIRPIDPAGNAYISKQKASRTTNVTIMSGLMDDLSFSNDFSFIGLDTSRDGSNLIILTRSSGITFTSLSVALDTNYHTLKGVNNTTDHKAFVDGILEATKTTDIPTTKMQPAVVSITRNTTAVDADVLYYEGYNI